MGLLVMDDIHTETHFWWKGFTVTSVGRRHLNTGSLKWLKEEVKPDAGAFVVQRHAIAILTMSTILWMFSLHIMLQWFIYGEEERYVWASPARSVFRMVYMAGGLTWRMEVTAHATPAIEHLRSCLQLLALICVMRVSEQVWSLSHS